MTPGLKTVFLPYQSFVFLFLQETFKNEFTSGDGKKGMPFLLFRKVAVIYPKNETWIKRNCEYVISNGCKKNHIKLHLKKSWNIALNYYRASQLINIIVYDLIMGSYTQWSLDGYF